MGQGCYVFKSLHSRLLANPAKGRSMLVESLHNFAKCCSIECLWQSATLCKVVESLHGNSRLHSSSIGQRTHYQYAVGGKTRGRSNPGLHGNPMSFGPGLLRLQVSPQPAISQPSQRTQYVGGKTRRRSNPCLHRNPMGFGGGLLRIQVSPPTRHGFLLTLED